MISISQTPRAETWVTIEAAKGDAPAFEILFAPVGRSLRRRAHSAALKDHPELADPQNADIDELLDGIDDQARHLIRAAAKDWRGVFDTETKAPVPFTIDALDAALADEESGFFDLVNDAWIEPMRKREREKNASSASPNGTGKVETVSPKVIAD